MPAATASTRTAHPAARSAHRRPVSRRPGISSVPHPASGGTSGSNFRIASAAQRHARTERTPGAASVWISQCRHLTAAADRRRPQPAHCRFRVRSFRKAPSRSRRRSPGREFIAPRLWPTSEEVALEPARVRLPARCLPPSAAASSRAFSARKNSRLIDSVPAPPSGCPAHRRAPAASRRRDLPVIRRQLDRQSPRSG